MDKDQGDLFIECIHCNGLIAVNKKDINCKKFVHAVYKDNALQQVNPHASKETCVKLRNENLIYGCANAFELIQQPDGVWKPFVREYG